MKKLQFLPLFIDPWSKKYYSTHNFKREKEPETTAGLTRNYFVAELSKVARYALPFIKNIDFML